MDLKSFTTEDLLFELNQRISREEINLSLLNSMLSKYGIYLTPAPIHHCPPWETVIINRTIPLINR